MKTVVLNTLYVMFWSAVLMALGTASAVVFYFLYNPA